VPIHHCDFLLIIHDLLSDELLDVEYYRDLETWVRGHSRSVKLVPFESLGAVSYSPSIVIMAVSVAVCEIVSVKEWRDLENQVGVRSMSSKMAPFDRPYATFYWSAIANIALSVYLVPFSTYLTLNSIVTLKSGLKVTQGH